LRPAAIGNVDRKGHIVIFSEQSLAEFLGLCGAVRDGSLSVEQFQKLQSVLHESAEARAYYVQFMQLDCFFENQDQVAMERLMDDSGAPTIPANAASESSLGSVSGISPGIAPPYEQPLSDPLAMQSSTFDAGVFPKLWAGFRLPMVWLLAGSLLTAAIMLFFRPNARPESRLGSETLLAPAAYLTSANGCAWGGSLPQVHQVGSSIKVGDEITLHEGIAEFRLASGVSMNVEGPAALLLFSPTSIVLRHGKITMHVPWEAPEVRVLVGDCRLTARDAEFGVDVVRNSIEVHAFSGSVLATRTPFADRPTPATGLTDDFDDDVRAMPLTIEEGTAIAFISDQHGLAPPREQKADRSRFASNLSMAGSLPVSPQYVAAILNADPKLRPASYWRFESIAGRVVKNEIEGAPNLKAIGELCLSGTAANNSIDLGRPHSSGHLLSERPIPSLDGHEYSVEVWAKPSHFHQGVLASLTVKPKNIGSGPPSEMGFRLELERGYDLVKPGSVRFLQRNPPAFNRGSSCFSNRLYGLRYWQHIVAVHRGTSTQLFLDGKKVAEGEGPKRIPSDLFLVVGQAYTATIAEAEFIFVGQLDELAMYSRALSPEEIIQHYKLIQSEQHESPGI
jgi:hypothetical protein